MKMISNFVEVSKKEIKDRKDYCILVYATLSPLNRDLKLIYKDIDEFEKKVEIDIRGIIFTWVRKKKI
jgi:hypothetical protein